MNHEYELRGWSDNEVLTGLAFDLKIDVINSQNSRLFNPIR